MITKSATKHISARSDSFYSYAIAVACILMLWGLKHVYAWYYAGILILVIFVIYRRLSRYQVPWFLELFQIMGLLSYSISAFYFRTDFFTGDVNRDLFAANTLWMALFGNAFFSFACLFTIQKMTSAEQVLTAACWHEPLPKSILYRLYGVGLLLNTVGYRMAPDSLKAVVTSFGNLEVIALAIFLYQSVCVSSGFYPPETKWGICGLAFWVVRSTASTMFGQAISVLLTIYTLFTRSMRVWAVLSGIGFVFVFAPLVQDVKKEMRSGGNNAPQLFIQNFQTVIIKGDREAYLKGFDDFMDRLNIFKILMVIKDNMDTRQNFANGETLKSTFFWALVPRFVYPKKPITGGMSYLAMDYADMFSMPGTSIGVGPISEFYINYGLSGVFVGMTLLGVFYGFILQKMFSHSIQPTGFVCAALTFSSVIRPETNLADSFGGTVRLIVVWFVLIIYIQHTKKRTAQPIS